MTAQSVAGERTRREPRGESRVVASWRACGAKLRCGLVIVGSLVLFALVAPLFLPDANAQDLGAALSPPSTTHPLGTESLGRDVLTWIAGGLRVGLLVSGCVVLISGVVGIAIGSVAGYVGGIADAILMRIVDLHLAIPPLLLFIAASAVVSPSIPSLIILISTISWVPYARLIRTRVRNERGKAYLQAARLAGASRRRIYGKHLLRQSSSIILVIGSLQLGYVILWEAGLSFLGLGIRPPHTSLGLLISQGKDVLGSAPWLMLAPGLTIVLLVTGFNLVGDGLRDLFHEDADFAKVK